MEVQTVWQGPPKLPISPPSQAKKVPTALLDIKLLESPIPTPAATATSSQKAHFDNISGTKRGSIDPLVSKRPEKNSE